LGFLGSGSFAQVYKAIYKNKIVAVKQYSQKNNEKPGKSDMEYFHEVDELKKTSHENIIKLLAAGEYYNSESKKWKKCIIIEYADMGSLHHLLYYKKEIDYTLGHAFSWLLQCANAIDYLHSKTKPTLHRDLKPLKYKLIDLFFDFI
jgi:mitogen-activated protein kinase kinase kinase 7